MEIANHEKFACSSSFRTVDFVLRRMCKKCLRIRSEYPAIYLHVSVSFEERWIKIVVYLRVFDFHNSLAPDFAAINIAVV